MSLALPSAVSASEFFSQSVRIVRLARMLFQSSDIEPILVHRRLSLLHPVFKFSIPKESTLGQTVFVTLTLAACLDDNFGN
jgi:hypothetical protein